MSGETFFSSTEERLFHYGQKYRSGRYPYGSGENPYQHDPRYGFLTQVKKLRDEGMTDAMIAKGMNMSSTQLRARYQMSREWQRAEEMNWARKLSDEGKNNVEIAEIMGRTEGTIRNYLKDINVQRNNVTKNTAEMLKRNVDKYGFIDVGAGVENGLGVTKNRLNTAVAMLEEQGYVTQNIQVEQVGTGYKTYVKVLCPAGTSYLDVVKNKGKIKLCDEISTDRGEHYVPKFLDTPVNVDPKRIQVNYAETGGTEKDGLIEIRRGCEDLQLGNATYAQVRIAVDGTHYLKGMAVYSDDLPKGVDIRFNTNKHVGTPMLGPKDNTVLKPLKPDPITKNPFGAEITQFEYEGSDGKKHQSPINLVNQEGEWGTWSKNIASQVLSKQPIQLAKNQLNLAYADKKAEFEEIKNLTNPEIRKKLLFTFADNCDAAAVNLKAAALPRQATHVILPVQSIKPNEIYAPNYKEGEQVALIRYPHGGTFEIPLLKVNNHNAEAEKMMGKNAADAVGINMAAAQKLSGADFDGDTVLVIPTRHAKIVTSTLKELENFEPKEEYRGYPGMKVLSEQAKQTEMGKVTNLITDMTLKGAPPEDLVRAVKHSMVIIDAAKHELDYKRSEKDNRISELKEKYQKDPVTGSTGAGTVISRAKSEEHVPLRTMRYHIDENTGELTYETAKDSDRFYYETRTYKDGTTKKIKKERMTKSTKMREPKDAFDLVSDKNSPLPMETVYATYANRMKALANTARKEYMATKNTKKEPSAAKIYSEEVNSLNSKLNIALSHAPKERQAQLIANCMIEMQKESNPDMDKEQLKKFKGKALLVARERVGEIREDGKKGRQLVDITPKEWEAIQAGAISSSKIEAILNNTDLDKVKEYAMPRAKSSLTPAKISRIKAMKRAGYTNEEIASQLGFSASTVSKALKQNG